MIQFGTGDVFVRRVATGTVTAIPARISGIQDISVEISQKTENLPGQYKMAEDIADSDMEISVKGSFNKFNIATFNTFMFNGAVTAGIKKMAIKEAHSIPGSVAYTVTVTNATNFLNNLEVVDATTGQILEQVAAGSEVLGKYSVDETTPGQGVYTFHADDKSKAMLFSYVWTDAATGQTLTVKNELQGTSPVVELWLRQPYKGENGLHLYRVRCSKVSQPQKRGGYMVSDFEGKAFPDPAGNILEWFEANPGL